MKAKQQVRKLQEYLDKQKVLMEKYGITNTMAAPGMQKIVVNIGAGRAKDDNALLEQLVDDLANITGQRPVIIKSRKAVSNFKLRENQPVGLKVTLRGERMWEFFDKLVSVVLPRVKDFRGVSYKSFDGNGNYSIGLSDQTVFPEIDTTKVMKYHPLQIIINTVNATDDQSLELLSMLGMPFQKKKQK